MIPYRQYIDNKDLSNVNKVLRSNIISRGRNIEKFEYLLKNLIVNIVR